MQGEQRKAEQLKYGIEYDDDYDYLQHLRDPCAPPEQYSVHVNQNNEDEEYEDDEEEDQQDQENEVNVDRERGMSIGYLIIVY